MRRLVTSAVLGMLGTALIVSACFAQQNASLGKDGSKDYNGQFTKVGYVTSTDSTGKKVTDAQGLPVSLTNGDATYGDLKSTGLSALTIASGSTYTSDLVDLSQYRYATLIMTWGTAAASDSSNIGFGVRLFNKQTGAWGSDDSAIESRIAPFFTGAVLFSPEASGTRTGGTSALPTASGCSTQVKVRD